MLLPAQLFKRKLDSHKGDYGHLFILAGSAAYTGAACLCANAAMRAGAGAVTLGLPESLQPIASAKLTEVMTLALPQTKQGSISPKACSLIKNFLKKANILLLGPGLSGHAQTKKLVRSLVTSLDLPMVLDADGLNALAGNLSLLKKVKRPIIMTPHPKELSRLIKVDIDKIQSNRKEVAKDFALRYNVTLILKGYHSIVASPGKAVYVNTTGNPGMATAGSGDVLAGIVAAFLAQGMTPYEAACAGVYVHGLAGDKAAKEKTQVSLIASDIIDYLPRVIKKLKVKSFK